MFERRTGPRLRVRFFFYLAPLFILFRNLVSESYSLCEEVDKDSYKYSHDA